MKVVPGEQGLCGSHEQAFIPPVPCLILRRKREGPAALARGSRSAVGTETQSIIAEARRALSDRAVGSPVPLRETHEPPSVWWAPGKGNVWLRA
jgi:hypothetical protein